MADDATDYYAEVRQWLSDERRQDRRRARAMALLATAGVAVAGVMAAALVVAMPLKRTEPYVVRVDTATGVVDVVLNSLPGAAVGLMLGWGVPGAAWARGPNQPGRRALP